MEFDDMQVTSGDSREKNSDLDRYGVWVKKPPRTIHDSDNNRQNMPCDDLPSPTNFENQVSMPQKTDGIVSDSPEIDDITFDMVDFDTELKDIPEMENVNEDISTKEDNLVDEVNQEKPDTFQESISEFDITDDEPDGKAQINPEPDFSDITEIQEVDFSELLDAEDSSINDNQTEQINSNTFESPQESQTEQIVSDPENEKTISDITESIPDFGDGEISLDAFFADSPTPKPSADNSAMETVDMDSFGDGEISLDAFFDSGDEVSFSVEDFIPTEKKEKNDIIDDPPLDIQLSFDDDFVLNTKADPTGQMENFGDGSFSDFSSIIVDDSGLGFDDLFDNIVDESAPSVSDSTIVKDDESIIEQTQVSQTAAEFDEVTDFDDLLGELEDSTGTAAAPKDNAEKAFNNIVDYDITVSMDDDDVQEIRSIQTDTEDEDIVDDISLYMDEPEKTQQNQGSHLDRTHSSEYTTSYVPPDDDFDIDKLMSEVEDIGGGNMQTDASNNENNNEMTEAMMSQSDMAVSNDIFDDDFFEADPMIANPIISEDIEGDVQETTLPDFLEEEIPVDEQETSVNSFAEEILQEENFEEPMLVDDNFTEDTLIEESLPEEILVEDSLPENDETIIEDSLSDTEIDEMSEPILEEEGFSENMDSPIIEEEIPFVSDEATELESEPVFESNNEEIAEEKTPEVAFENDENDSVSNETAFVVEPEQPKEEKSDILNSIADELAVLRQEISMLKNDLENMKKSGIIANSDSLEQNEKPSSNESAFFSDTSDDDTIALSGDELSNILNTADFTEEEVEETQESEPYEEPIDEEPIDEEQQSSDDILYADDDEESNNGLPQLDFESEQLKEPEIDEIGFDNEPEQELPEEIEIPVTEDVVEEEPEELLQEDESVPTVDDDIFEEPSTGSETIEDIFADKEETIDEEEVAFVTSEPEFEETEESLVSTVAENSDEAETSDDDAESDDVEEEITDEPTEAMFESNQWDDESTLAAVATTGIAATAVAAAVIDEINEDESDSDNNETISEEIDIEDNEAEEPVIEEPVAEETLDDTMVMDTVSEETDSDITETVSEPAESLSQPEESSSQVSEIPDDLKRDIKSVLAYMDQLLDNLPEEKIAEFARSEHFELYKKLFTELGLS